MSTYFHLPPVCSCSRCIFAYHLLTLDDTPCKNGPPTGGWLDHMERCSVPGRAPVSPEHSGDSHGRNFRAFPSVRSVNLRGRSSRRDGVRQVSSVAISTACRPFLKDCTHKEGWTSGSERPRQDVHNLMVGVAHCCMVGIADYGSYGQRRLLTSEL